MISIKFRSILFLSLIFILLAGCGGPAIQPVTGPQISRHPVPWQSSFQSGPITTLPVYDPNSTEPFQYDFRWADLTQLDLSKSLDLLSMADFDSKTQWPSARMLPKGFSLEKVMELAKDPGLGIRKLHDRGIDGRGR